MWIIDQSITKLYRCWLGKIEWSETVVTEDPSLWGAALTEAAEELRRRFRDKAELAADPCIRAAREAYTAYGANAKRYPPAAEALAKRVLSGKQIPSINTMVDFNNLVSSTTLCPVGSYDRAAIRGAVRFQIGTAGQSYVAIGNDPFLAEGFPTFVDDLGPFGGTTRDSIRTMVKPGVTEAVTIVMSFVDPAVHGLVDVIRRHVERAEALGLGKRRSFEWIS